MNRAFASCHHHPCNPLHGTPQADRFSSYWGVQNGRFQRVSKRPEDGRDPATFLAHQRVTEKILSDGFPCVAARSAINRKSYRFGLYPELGTTQAAWGLCHDLYEFASDARLRDAPFTTFIAAFEAPVALNEIEFERLLWQQLQAMHAIDVRHFSWDDSVSDDPDSANFSLSIGGRAYFVVGMAPCASRQARAISQPCLVFNPHEQFEVLREQGKFTKLQQAIRQRDLALQGSINPVLSAFGEQAESRQYSGRAVPPHWKCPFQHHERIS